MKKVQLMKIMLMFSLVIFCFTNVFASTQIDDTQETESSSDTAEEEALKAKKEEINTMIDECLEELKTGLAKIDKKVESLKTKDEYKTYPSIRLNVEMPLFGLTSIVEYKLKITNDVSTADVASGYSIRSIVKDKVVKVPSFSVASIVVITRDVHLNKDITLSDSTTVLLKLMQYINQLENVNVFLDDQVNNVFTSYIPGDRASKLSDIHKRLDTISQELVEQDKYITYIHLLDENASVYEGYLASYNEINKKAYELKQIASNVLISDDQVSDALKQLVNVEKDMYTFKENIANEYETCVANIDSRAMYTKVKNEFVVIRDDIQKYIDESTEEVEVVGNNEQNEENSNEVTVTDDETNSKPKMEEKTIYNVTSENILEYMNNAIKSIDEKIKKLDMPQEEVPAEEQSDKKQLSDEEKAKLAKDEKIQIVEEAANIYSDYIYKQNKFFLDNLNLILKDSTNKISDLIKYTDKNVLQNMKYIYLKLPDNIEYYLKLNNANANIGVITLTNQIKNELISILTTNININTLYNEMINEQVKDGRRGS